MTLSSQQLRVLGIKTKQGQTVKLIDYFDLRDCTCFETFWGIWRKKDAFYVNKRTINRINREVLSSDKDLDFRTITYIDGIESVQWEPAKWMANNLILGLDGRLYRQGKKLQNSDVNLLRNLSLKRIRIIKLSPKIISLKKQEKWLSRYDIKLNTLHLSD